MAIESLINQLDELTPQITIVSQPFEYSSLNSVADAIAILNSAKWKINESYQFLRKHNLICEITSEYLSLFAQLENIWREFTDTGNEYSGWQRIVVLWLNFRRIIELLHRFRDEYQSTPFEVLDQFRRLRYSYEILISELQFFNQQDRIEDARSMMNGVQRQYYDLLITSQDVFHLIHLLNAPEFVIVLNRTTIMEDFIKVAEEHHLSYHGERLRVQFEGESGSDFGGLTREMLTILTPRLFNEAFLIQDNDLPWFPRNIQCTTERKRYLTAAGFLARLAIENDESLSSALPRAFCAKLKGIPMTLEHLCEVSPGIVANLEYSRQCYHEGDDHDLSLEDGRHVTECLFDDYQNEQIHLALESDVSIGFEAFQTGFNGSYENPWLNSLDTDALHKLLAVPAEVNWVEMQDTAKFKDYTSNHPTVKLFWSIFNTLSEIEKKKILIFITGSDHAPVRGFSKDPIIIQRDRMTDDSIIQLPKSHTCFKILDLPVIDDEETMKGILNICIEYCLEFGKL
jgi:hypothetical protein